MSKLALALVVLLLSPSASAEDSFLCISNLAAGFFYNKNTRIWKASSFAGVSQQFIIGRPTQESKDLFRKYFQRKIYWEIKKLGEKEPFMWCDNDFDDMGNLICDDSVSLYEIRMNSKNGRFLLIYPVGYWSDDKNAKEGERLREGDDMPNMEIGKCSPL